MKKIIFTLAILYLSLSNFAATGDTTYVYSHTATNLNSPPSNDDVWTVFPNTTINYQKIIMKFTLGCGTPNCSGWDYTVNTYLGKKNGLVDSTIVSIDTTSADTTWSYSDQVKFIEIGRLITPYGTYMANNSNGFNNSWAHPYYYDVTDYAALLKDSVNIRVFYSGWSDAFSAKIEFMMIEGQPTRQVENVREIYNQYVGYPNSAAFENVVSAKTFPISANVTSAKVSLIITGHESQGEFDPHGFQLKVNSVLAHSELFWKADCGMTAIAPQGGTWIFNRANWCPGEKVNEFEMDITPYITSGQNASIDLDLDDFIVQAGEGAGYGISAHLITYSAQKNNDVTLEEIIAPNNDKNYSRYNPICTKPIVKIKNTGKLPLTYAEIAYRVKGGETWYYEWTGYLKPFETEIVTLPEFSWNGLDTNDRQFIAIASWPNNVPDEYESNNKLVSRFDMTPQLNESFYVYVKANNQPQESSLLVRYENLDTLLFKNNFVANGISRDTFQLFDGSYALDIYDYDNQWEGGDGLSWWLNTQQGWENTGSTSMRKTSNNQVIKNFNGDFGSNIHYEFTVGYPLGYNEPREAPDAPVHTTGINTIIPDYINLNVFPNPANEKINLSLDAKTKFSGKITMTDINGRIVNEFQVTPSLEVKHVLDTRSLANGFYTITFSNNVLQIVKKVTVLH
jgi:hypothetical protein